MASRSVNKVILIGNLTRDPELKYTPSGTAVCTFGVATNRSWSTATGELKEDVQFHRILAWQKLAELCNKILAKGRKIYLEGRLTYRTFIGKDGVQRSIAEIILDDFVVCDDRRKVEVPAEEVAESEVNKVEPPQDIVSEPEVETSQIKEKASKSKKDKKDEEVKNDEARESSDDEKVDPDDIPF